jgi:hypothetical protein
MICEVKNGHVLGDPHTVGGHQQQPNNGFNKWWRDWHDINSMRAVCARTTPCTRPSCSAKSSTSSFCVVSRNQMKGAYCDVEAARRALNLHAESGGSRMICEVKDGGRVLGNPHMVGGHEQLPQNGFNKWWRDWHDIHAMRAICAANTPCTRPVCSRKEETSFCVVSQGKVIGASCSVEEARLTLNQNARGSRMICEVKDGRVLGDPHTVGGHKQLPQNGFNKWWRDWHDIRSMAAVCQRSGTCTQPKC